MFTDKTVLITGGTGSFGKAFTKHLLEKTDIKKIIIFSRDELKQSVMEAEMNNDSRLRFFIGDVRDLPRLQRAFAQVDIVVHAAALKQVPTLEYNPFEAVKTNILGSQNVIDASIDQGVDKVIMVSTDKAAQPINLYGATKLCAEKLFINGNVYSQNREKRTKFSCVRYGNVIGSRGSIIEILVKGKLNGQKKFTITDERMTRFWITYDTAFQLILFTLEIMQGGEIIIPKIPSMKVLDMFDAIVPDTEREIIGIRPGEKLHEVLLTGDEARHAIELDEYYVILPEDKNIFNIEDMYVHIVERGNKPEKDFSYMSHTNERWIDRDALDRIIKELRLT